MQLTLIHVDGSKKGQTETFSQPVVTVGRDPSSNVAFDAFKDIDVSSRHAQFVVAGDQLMISDLNSKNGTFVDGKRINGQSPVQDGAVVQFGDKGPKVQVSFRVAPAGPGKKTQMIADLQGQITGAQAQAAKERSAARARNVVLLLFVFFLIVLGVVGFFVWSSLQEKKALAARIEKAKEQLAAIKSEAASVKAATLAKADYDKAKLDEDSAAAAEKDPAMAKHAGTSPADLYEKAVEGYRAAVAKSKEAASSAKFDDLKKQLEEANKRLTASMAEAQKKHEQENAKRQDEIKKADDERIAKAEAEAAELKKKLEAQKTVQDLAPTIQAALAQGKEKPVLLALERVEEKLKDGPNDDLSKWQGQLKARLDEIKALPATLDKVASDAKPRVVMVQATSYALPKSQTEKTTHIREFLTSVSGTGFFVAADKVATAKELVEPWKFDPQALALQKKWDEKGYMVHTRVDVLALDANKVFQVVATTNAELDAPTATVVWQGADAWLDEKARPVVSFMGADVAVDVNVHRRDTANVAMIKLTSAIGQPMALAAPDALKTGDLVIALGERSGGPEAPTPDAAQLYSQKAEVLAAGNRAIIGAGGYGTWIGGPVLDAKGNLVGLIVDVNSDKMTILGPEGIKDAAKN